MIDEERGGGLLGLRVGPAGRHSTWLEEVQWL